MNEEKRDRVRLHANNGGDIFDITDVGYDVVHLRVGHCCIAMMDDIVPVELLTATFANLMMQYDSDIIAIIDSFGWDERYKERLKEKVIAIKMLARDYDSYIADACKFGIKEPLTLYEYICSNYISMKDKYPSEAIFTRLVPPNYTVDRDSVYKEE